MKSLLKIARKRHGTEEWWQKRGKKKEKRRDKGEGKYFLSNNILENISRYLITIIFSCKCVNKSQSLRKNSSKFFFFPLYGIHFHKDNAKVIICKNVFKVYIFHFYNIRWARNGISKTCCGKHKIFIMRNNHVT